MRSIIREGDGFDTALRSIRGGEAVLIDIHKIKVKTAGEKKAKVMYFRVYCII